MIEQLIRALRKEGFDPTAEELADTLWLLSRISPSTSTGPRAPSASRAEAETPLPPPLERPDASEPAPPPVSQGQRKGSIRSVGSIPAGVGGRQSAPLLDVHQPAGGEGPAELSRETGLPFQSPRAPALPGTLELGRALRPLKRRVPSRVERTLDEEKTARRIAEKSAFPLVFRPRPERWLDVVLVVDEGSSMAIWQRTVRELQSLLERHGAFRQVRRLGLLTEGRGDLRLVSRSAGGTRREVGWRELIDPGGRRLFLLVSDCVSACWEDGRVADALRAWAGRGPVALVQVLPERLWHRSGLGAAVPVRLKAPFPAAGNLHLQSNATSWLDADDLGASSRVVPLPVLELDRGSLEPWAKLIAGSGTDTGGVMLSALPGQGDTDALHALDETRGEGNTVPTARERVAHFRATASPRARQLATLFASASYLSLPVIWQIRQVMLPEATAGNVAEVFLGGLLREASTRGQAEEPELVRYDFFEGVRELLLDAVDGRSAVRVLELVSDYVTSHLGYATSFRALLRVPTEVAGEAIPERERPFARIGASVLARLGGEYARLAERLESRTGTKGGSSTGHQGRITGIAVTETGRRAVSVSRDKTLKVWDLDTGRELATLEGDRDWITGCAITRDGKRAVSVSRDGWLRVWNLEKSAEVLSVKGHTTARVFGCAVTDDGRRAVSASADGSLKVWELATGRVLAVCRGHSDWVLGCAVTGNGRRVVSASRDRTLKVWDLESGSPLATLQGHEGAVTGCAVTADGRLIVSASEDRTLKVWDLRSSRCLRTLNGDGDFTVLAVTRAAVWAGDVSGKIWLLPLELGESRVSDEQLVVLRSRQPIQGLVDESSLTLEGHHGAVNACAVMRDGRRVLSASDDGTLRLWDLERGQELSTPRRHQSAVYGCAVTPDGKWAVSASRDWSLRLWPLGSDNAQATWPATWTGAGHQDWVRGCAVSPDGRRVVSASDDWTLKVWDLKTGRELRSLLGHERSVWSCLVTPDGRRVVSASEDKTLKVWDLETGHVRSLVGHAAGVWGCAVTPDGKRVVSASSDGTLRVWDLEAGRTLATLKGHEDEVCGCAVTPDGKRVVSACRDGTLKVWDLETGGELRTLTGHTNAVLGCAITPDGRRAVSVSEDRTLKVWELS